MRSLKFLHFGLFLILLGLVVMALGNFALIGGAIGLVANLASQEDMDFYTNLTLWGGAALLIGYILNWLGKLFCLGNPEKQAQNLMIATVVCDCIVIAVRTGILPEIGWVRMASLISLPLPYLSYYLFLTFLSRVGDNIGETRVKEYVTAIYWCFGLSILSIGLLIFSPQLGLVLFCLVIFALLFFYMKAVYSLFRALPLYIEEVKLGYTDPSESAEVRAKREREDRLDRFSGPKSSKSLAPEEPQGTPPEGAKLYRIPKDLGPLHLAVKEGDRYKVELCINQGADVNEPVKHGLTPLHIAASSGVMNVADALLKAGADVNAPCELGLTPIFFAVQSANVNIVGFFLSKGANLHHKNAYGFTPLHWACSAPHPNLIGPNRVKMVEFLIQQRADLNAVTSDGKTPRELAMENQLEEIVSTIDRNLKGATSPAPVIKQEDTQDSESAASDEGAVHFDGLHLSTLPSALSPFQAAVKDGDIDKIETQLSAGASVAERTPNGLGPIHITAITGVMNGTQRLLQAGADVNEVSECGLTPLFMAVHLNNVNMVGFLIARGANVNHQDAQGRTVLHWAVAAPHEKLEGQNRIRMVEFLLSQGADRSIADRDGKTPQDFARASSQSEDLVPLFTGGQEAPDVATSDTDDDDDYYV